MTPVKAAHFTELRARIDAVRIAVGLGRFPWTDSRVVAGVTPVKGVHMSELRTALAQAYYAAGRTDWLQYRSDTGGNGNTRLAHQRVAARGGDPGTIIESPQMRVGSGGASSMPPQQRNSIEINAPGRVEAIGATRDHPQACC